MNSKMIKMSSIALAVIIFSLILFATISESVGAGYVAYIYDKTVSVGDPNTINGTSVIDKQRTGLIFINPFTQDILKFPTTIVARSWTRSSEGDNNGVDWSVTTSSSEGKDVIADIYISVRPKDVSSIISSFGTKSFNFIVDDDIYGLARGKLSMVTQEYSVYDMQSKKSEIQLRVKELLSNDLENIYGVELVRYEIGTITPPADIQAKIDEKTSAMNAVELAKLDRQRQDEINQKIVDEQKAESEKELLRRQNEADASAYERERAAKAELSAQEAMVKTAELKVEQARLEKQAELEKQAAYTESYFRDKELDIKREAVAKVNGSVKTIVTDDPNSVFAELFGLQEVLGVVSK